MTWVCGIFLLPNRESSMSTTKEEALQLISRLPEEVAWEDIMYRLYVKRKIEEGIKAADEGRIISHDQVKELFARE
jgi:predicted transcriptional regulator